MKNYNAPLGNNNRNKSSEKGQRQGNPSPNRKQYGDRSKSYNDHAREVNNYKRYSYFLVHYNKESNLQVINVGESTCGNIIESLWRVWTFYRNLYKDYREQVVAKAIYELQYNHYNDD